MSDSPRHAPNYEAFVRLFMAHEARLRGLLRALLPAWEDVDDVLQETSLVAWSKLDQFTPGTNFMGWISTIARFKAIHHLRKKTREVLIFDDELLETIAEEAVMEGDRREREHVALRHCLDKLPPAQSALLQLAYQPGLKFHEAAEKAGKSAAAFYKILQRLRAILQDCIQGELKQEASP